MGASDTIEDPSDQLAAELARSLNRRGPQPGITIVFSNGAPCFEVIPLDQGRLDVGRELLGSRNLDDERMSRRHLSVAFQPSGDASGQDLWTIRDLGSTNGTRVDGVAVERTWTGSRPRVIRAGQTLLVPSADITGHIALGLDASANAIIGPQLRAVHQRIAGIARAGQNLLILGPSGSGKEIAANLFHRACGGTKRPFVALNCAAIPAGLAERILFGTRRGAYSGAVSDAIGLVQAADGGSLFLDEIGELPLEVQAKFLRVIETKQVLPLGALEPVRVDFRICAATLVDLRSEVVAGRFREDLYFRIGRPEVSLPALSARLEEIPWLIQHALREVDPNSSVVASLDLVEQCMLRPWPGNVRELLAELRCATALAVGGVVGLEQLSPGAGNSLHVETSTSASATSASAEDPIVVALRSVGGNVSLAAKQLGISRSKIRRFVEKAGIDLDTFRRG